MEQEAAEVASNRKNFKEDTEEGHHTTAIDSRHNLRELHRVAHVMVAE
jgi:hypothetical protein